MHPGDEGAGGQLLGQDAATYLGLDRAAHAVLRDVDAAYLNHFASVEFATLQAHMADLEMLKRLFIENRHGCWWGPGHVCEEEQDEMDAVCHVHDNTLRRLPF